MAKRIPGGRSAQQVKAQMGLGADEQFESFEQPSEIKVQPSLKEFERVFTKTKKIVSDVFKLTVAEVIKQTGLANHPNKDPDSFNTFEHTHVFRTFDSDGRRHDKCVSTAGHFHDVEWDYDKDGKPYIVSVSGPKTMGRKQVLGKWKQISIPVNDYDQHTHDFQYLNSMEVSARTTNIEAQRVIAVEATKGAPPPGAREM